MDRLKTSDLDSTAKGAADLARGGADLTRGGKVLHQAPKSKEERHIDFFSSLAGWGWLPYNLQLMTAVSFVMRKVGLGKYTAIPRSLGNGMMQSFELTPMSQGGKLLGNFLRAADTQHQIVGNTKRGYLLRWADASDKFFAGFGNWLKKTFAPLSHGIGHLADKHEGSGFGKFMQRRLSWVAEARSKKNGTKAQQQIEQLTKAVNDALEPPKNGMFSFFTRPFRNKENAEGLRPLLELLNNEELKKDPKAHMEAVAELSQRLVREGKLLPTRSGLAWKTNVDATKALSYLTSSAEHAGAVGGSLRTVLKNAGKMMGHTSVMGAVVTAASALGMYVAFKTAQHENHKDAATLKQLGEDLGDHNSPYLTEVKATTQKNKLRHYGSGAFNAAGEAVMMTQLGPGGGGMGDMAMMGGQFMLPEMGKFLLLDNAVLKSYETLKQAERGEAEVSPQEKLQMVRHLVGAVPVVASRGGYYNQLAAPVAEALVKKDLSVRDTLRFINDPAQFTALASEVKASVDAAKAEQAKVKEQQTAAAPTGGKAAPIAAGKPGMIVSAERAHAGTIGDRQLAMAAQ